MKKNLKTKSIGKKVTAMKKRKVVSKITSRKKNKSILKFNRKIANYTMFLVSLIAVIVVIAIVFEKVANPTTISEQNKTQTSANSLKTQAIQLLHSDPTKAKTLLQQAKEKYVAINDKNNVVDVESQLYLIDHVKATK